MRDAVKANLVAWFRQYEGYCPWMYLDGEGFVTCGIGHLYDPTPTPLPWQHRDGTPAVYGEILTEWKFVKGMQERRKLGGGAFASVTSLRLTATAVAAIFQQDADFEWQKIIERFAWLDQAPAGVQLGTLDMAFNMGAAFHFPHWEAAAAQGDWAICATECATAGGPQKRNDERAHLFASCVTPDPDVLAWP